MDSFTPVKLTNFLALLRAVGERRNPNWPQAFTVTELRRLIEGYMTDVHPRSLIAARVGRSLNCVAVKALELRESGSLDPAGTRT